MAENPYGQPQNYYQQNPGGPRPVPGRPNPMPGQSVQPINPQQEQQTQNNFENEFNFDDFGPATAYQDPKKKRNQLLLLIGGGIIVLIIFVVVLIAAFRNKTPVDETTETSKYLNTNVDLVWMKPQLPGQDADVFEDIAKNFGRLYKNVDIEIVNPEYDEETYYKDLLTSLAKRSGPDIFTIRNDDLPAYKDFMSPIRSFAGANLADYRTNFVDLAVRDTMIQDQVYGVTMYVDNLQLYYNDTLLSQNNISIPAQSWEDIDRQIPTLRKKDLNDDFLISPISLGTGGLLGQEPNIKNHEDIIATMIFQRGGQLYDYKEGKPKFAFSSNNAEDNPIKRAIQYYLDFADPYSERYSWSIDSPNNLDAFVEGKLAYMFGYKETSAIIEARNSRLNYGVTSIPQYNNTNKKTFGKFYMDGINKSLEYESETSELSAAKRFWAEEFLYYLTAVSETQTTDPQYLFASQTGLPSARKDIINIQMNESEKATQIFAEGALVADNYYKPNVLKTEQIWTDLIENITIRKHVFDEALEAASKKYKQIVDNGPEIR